MQFVRCRTQMLLVFLFAALVSACSDSITSPISDKHRPNVPDTVSTPPTTTTPPATSPTTSTSNPFAGSVLYVDPNSSARKTADSWRSSRPADAAQLDKIAQQSQADWFGSWNSDIQSAVASRVTTVTNAGALPVLVTYNILRLDCGNGGAQSADAYKTWIRGFAAGIGARKAVVILEPDALPAMGCLSAADQQVRTDLIKDAVQVLKAQGNVAVYIDAGHSNWISASTMITRLTNAGIAYANGFSLNVSNFQYNNDLISFGTAVSAGVGNKHFVFDSSRNGLGPGDTWCNPSGRALGTAPTANTGNPLVDAILWIKRPGESDGTCNGWQGGGAFLPEYALGLAQRASFGAIASN